MKKTIASLAFGIRSAAMVIAATAKTPPATISIDECQAKKPVVVFPHEKHFAITECKTCLHTQPDLTATSKIEVEKCSSCHLKPEKADTPNCTEMSMAKNPYHMLCLNCHKEKKAADPASKAPTICNGCHVGK